MNWKSKNQKQVRKCFPKAVLYILPSRKMENSIPPWPMWAQTFLVNCFAFSELIFECLCFSSALQLTSPKAKRMALHLEKENHCQKDKINSNKPFEILVLMNHRGLKKMYLWVEWVSLGTTVSTWVTSQREAGEPRKCSIESIWPFFCLSSRLSLLEFLFSFSSILRFWM